MACIVGFHFFKYACCFALSLRLRMPLLTGVCTIAWCAEFAVKEDSMLLACSSWSGFVGDGCPVFVLRITEEDGVLG